jgi:hypothetical protein
MKIRNEFAEEVAKDLKIKMLVLLRAPFEIGLILFYVLTLYSTFGIYLKTSSLKPLIYSVLWGLSGLGYFLITRKIAEEVKKRWDKLEEEAGDKYFQFIKDALKKSGIKQKSKLKGIVDCNILEISIGAIITAIIALILHALKVI